MLRQRWSCLRRRSRVLLRAGWRIRRTRRGLAVLRRFRPVAGRGRIWFGPTIRFGATVRSESVSADCCSVVRCCRAIIAWHRLDSGMADSLPVGSLGRGAIPVRAGCWALRLSCWLRTDCWVVLPPADERCSPDALPGYCSVPADSVVDESAPAGCWAGADSIRADPVAPQAGIRVRARPLAAPPPDDYCSRDAQVGYCSSRTIGPDWRPDARSLRAAHRPAAGEFRRRHSLAGCAGALAG